MFDHRLYSVLWDICGAWKTQFVELCVLGYYSIPFSSAVASCTRLCSWGLYFLTLLPYLFKTCLIGDRSGDFENQSRISTLFWFSIKEIRALLCCPPVMLNEDCRCLDMAFELQRKFCKNFYIFGPSWYHLLPVTTTNREVSSTNSSPNQNQVVSTFVTQ